MSKESQGKDSVTQRRKEEEREGPPEVPGLSEFREAVMRKGADQIREFETPVGGRISKEPWVSRWLRIPGINPEVAAWIKEGAHGEWREKPKNSQLQRLRRSRQPTREEWNVLLREEMEMLKKEVVERTTPEEGRLALATFVVPKKTKGKWRYILDARPLNKCFWKVKFRMEGYKTFLDLVRPEDWACSVDLTDAYWHVGIRSGDRSYLLFRGANGEAFRYKALPFGVSHAPRTFTKIMRYAAMILRQWGVRIVMYLDDILILGKTKEEAQKHTNWAIALLQYLGLTVSREKTEREAKRQVEFIGFRLDLEKQVITVSETKRRAWLEAMETLLRKDWVSVRESAGILGKTGSMWPAWPSVHLFTKGWLACQNDALKKWGGNYDGPMRISTEMRSEIAWIMHNHEAWTMRDFSPWKPTALLQTDSSLEGWGAILTTMDPEVPSSKIGPQAKPLEARGFWPIKAGWINHLELRTVRKALKAFQPWFETHHVRDLQIKADNAVTVALINKWNSCQSMAGELRELLILLKEWGVRARAEFIPGELNTRPDELSRMPNGGDYKLNPSTFRLCCQALDLAPQVDAFATAENKQVPRFWSRFWSEGTEGVDAFARTWHRSTPLWLNPPFSLMGRVLKKILDDQGEALVCAPRWPTASWWPLLRELSTRPPIRLPPRPDLFSPGVGATQLTIGPPPFECVVARISGSYHERTEWTL